MSHNKDWEFMTQDVKQLNLNPLFSVRKENIRCQSTRRNEKKRIRKSKNNFLSETNDLKINERINSTIHKNTISWISSSCLAQISLGFLGIHVFWAKIWRSMLSFDGNCIFIWNAPKSKNFIFGSFSNIPNIKKWGISNKNHVTSFQTAKGPKIQLFEFGALSSFEKI